ncbi:MAG: hypothetical protein IKJ93_00575, partial [Clostridia bacterium]|nr:hypothetical protein [Clostridia bacterium]
HTFCGIKIGFAQSYIFLCLKRRFVAQTCIFLCFKGAFQSNSPIWHKKGRFRLKNDLKMKKTPKKMDVFFFWRHHPESNWG